MFEMVLCSTNGLFLYILRDFFIFEHNCILFEFTLSPRQVIILVTRKHGRENKQRWKKAYLDMLIVSLV